MEEKKKSFYHVSELIPSISEELLGKKPEEGFLRYGLASLDRFTGGLHSRDLVLIAGGHDFKRYALCGKIIRNLAVMRKEPVLVVPFDIPPNEFIKMLVSNMTEINRSLLSAKKIAIHELTCFVASGLKKIKVSDIYFSSAADNDPQTVRKYIRSFLNLLRNGVVVFLGLPALDGVGQKPEWITEFETLKTTVKNNYAILACIAEEQIKDIAQVSNVVFQLVDAEDAAEISGLEITISRNTHGACGNVRLKYEPAFGTVEEYGSFTKESPK
jgi:hypothetical protein